MFAKSVVTAPKTFYDHINSRSHHICLKHKKRVFCCKPCGRTFESHVQLTRHRNGAAHSVKCQNSLTDVRFTFHRLHDIISKKKVFNCKCLFHNIVPVNIDPETTKCCSVTATDKLNDSKYHVQIQYTNLTFTYRGVERALFVSDTFRESSPVNFKWIQCANRACAIFESSRLDVTIEHFWISERQNGCTKICSMYFNITQSYIKSKRGTFLVKRK